MKKEPRTPALRHKGVMRTIGVSLFALSMMTTPAWGGLVDYNTPGDLVGNFSLNHAGAGIRYSEVGVGGIGGSGSIVPSNAIDAVHTTALFNQENFDFSVVGSSVTVSQFVFRQNDAGFPFEFSFQQLGVLQNTGDRFGVDAGPDSYVSLRVMSDTVDNTGVFLQTEVRGSADVSRTQQTVAGETANLVEGNWYRMWATFENVSSTQVKITGALEDWGTTAAAFQSTVLELTAGDAESNVDLSGLSGTTVLSDGDVWAGWRGFGEGGANLFDNFSAVPEPAGFVLIALGAGAVLSRRR